MGIIIAKEEINWGGGDCSNILLLPYAGKNSISFLYLLITTLISPVLHQHYSGVTTSQGGVSADVQRALSQLMCVPTEKARDWHGLESKKAKQSKDEVLACVAHIPHPD